MNAEMLLVKVDTAQRLEDVLLSWNANEGRGPLPMPGFPSRYEQSRSNKKRTLLTITPGDWTVLLEGGGYADETMCRDLSDELGTDAVIVGVFETTNSWATRKYASGKVVEQRFEPPSAFAEEFTRDGDELDDDATDMCRNWLEQNGWVHGILLFQDALREELPSELSEAEIRRIILPRR